jgi:hypothetical protein
MEAMMEMERYGEHIAVRRDFIGKFANPPRLLRGLAAR